MNEQQIKDYLNKELQRISFNAEKSFLEHDYSLYNKYGIQEQLLKYIIKNISSPPDIDK